MVVPQQHCCYAPCLARRAYLCGELLLGCYLAVEITLSSWAEGAATQGHLVSCVAAGRVGPHHHTLHCHAPPPLSSLLSTGSQHLSGLLASEKSKMSFIC